MSEEKYLEFIIRIDYNNKIHEESYFFKQTANDKKEGKLELLAKEDTLFPGRCIEDYEFIEESPNEYCFKLRIKEEENSFLFKINNENGELEVTEKSPKPYIHPDIKPINADAYQEIEEELDKDVKNHIIHNKDDNIPN